MNDHGAAETPRRGSTLIQRVTAVGLCLWVIGCLAWMMTTRTPWETKALWMDLPVHRTPKQDFVDAGLWYGLGVSGLLALLLLLTRSWWAGAEAVPVSGVRPLAEGPGSPRWYYPVVGLLAFYLVWQCWPAMDLSFWGDEAAMFTDFVHGRWQGSPKGGDLQGELRFIEVPWLHAFFCDYYGANHWLSTHLQRLALTIWQTMTGQPDWRFEEWVVRMVPLSAGVATLFAFASWLKWEGHPMAGLAGAAFLALHPAMIRFSVEARGYSLMIFFFVLVFWSLSRAMRAGRKRDWLAFGLAQLLALYSWKGAIYGLAFLNILICLQLLRSQIRWTLAARTVWSRWLAACAVGAMVFVPLAAPSQLQIRKSIETVRQRAKPMDRVWRNNLLSQSAFGVPWNEMDPGNPREVSMQRVIRQSPWTGVAAGIVALAFATGFIRLCRRHPFLAGWCLAILASGAVAAVHFKYGLRVELLTWYLVYQIPVLALLFGVAVTPWPGAVRYEPALAGRRSWPMAYGAATGIALAALAVIASAEVRDMQQFPRENLKDAVQLMRGGQEPAGGASDANIRTVWLWHHSPAYDPRAATKVRSLESLEAICREAREGGKPLYVVVGFKPLCELLFPDFMKALADPRQFEHAATFWGAEPVNNIDVYRMVP